MHHLAGTQQVQLGTVDHYPAMARELTPPTTAPTRTPTRITDLVDPTTPTAKTTCTSGTTTCRSGDSAPPDSATLPRMQVSSQPQIAQTAQTPQLPLILLLQLLLLSLLQVTLYHLVGSQLHRPGTVDHYPAMARELTLLTTDLTRILIHIIDQVDRTIHMVRTTCIFGTTICRSGDSARQDFVTFPRTSVSSQTLLQTPLQLTHQVPTATRIHQVTITIIHTAIKTTLPQTPQMSVSRQTLTPTEQSIACTSSSWTTLATLYSSVMVLTPLNSLIALSPAVWESFPKCAVHQCACTNQAPRLRTS